MSWAIANRRRFASHFTRASESHIGRRRKLLAAILMCLCLMSFRGAEAQEDPFGSDPFGEPSAPAPADTDAAPDAEGAAGAEDGAAEAVVEAPAETDPVVLTILDSRPTTPEQLLRAVNILINIGRWDLANGYLQQLSAIELNDEQLRQLHRRFGASLFLRLANEKQLDPLGPQFGRRVLEAVAQAARDPARVGQLVDALQDPARSATARRALRTAPAAAVPVLLSRLAAAKDEAEVRSIQRALVAMPPDASRPLIAGLDAEQDELRVRIFEVLAARGDRDTALYLLEPMLRRDVPARIRAAAHRSVHRLLGSITTREQARRRLLDELQAAFRRPADAPDEPQDTAETIWLWDTMAQTSVAQAATPGDVRRLQAVRLAEALSEIFPNDEQLQVLLLATRLEWHQASVGIDRPLSPEDAVWQQAEAAGPQRMQAVLALCMEYHRPAGAVAAARVLAKTGGIEQLVATSPTGFAPLIDALHYRDQRVQAAAVDAIMEIQPTEPFPGSARFRESLEFFLRSTPARRALVVHPRLTEGQTLVGLLNTAGFEADLVVDGSKALEQATAHPDYEFVLLSDRLSHPEATQWVQMLRTQPRGDALAVVILVQDLPIDVAALKAAGQQESSIEPGQIGAAAGDLSTVHVSIGESARELAEVDRYRDLQYFRYGLYAEEDANLIAVPRPHSLETIGFIIRQVQQLPARSTVAPTDRLERQAQILLWIVAALESPVRDVFDWARLEEGLKRVAYSQAGIPETATRAVAGLGMLATPTAQQFLADLASQPTVTVAVRQAAAAALADAIQRRGVLLTTTSIRTQYDRYNASATADRETQLVLGAVLDAIEAPTRPADAPPPDAGDLPPATPQPPNESPTGSPER